MLGRNPELLFVNRRDAPTPRYTVAAKENYYTSCNKRTIVLVVTPISGVVKVGAAVML